MRSYLFFFVLLLALYTATICTFCHHISLVCFILGALVWGKLRQMRFYWLVIWAGLQRRVSTLMCVLICQADGIDARSTKGHHKRLVHRNFAVLLLLYSCNDRAFDLLSHIRLRTHLIQLAFFLFSISLCLQLALWISHILTLGKEGCVCIVCIFI